MRGPRHAPAVELGRDGRHAERPHPTEDGQVGFVFRGVRDGAVLGVPALRQRRGAAGGEGSQRARLGLVFRGVEVALPTARRPQNARGFLLVARAVQRPHLAQHVAAEEGLGQVFPEGGRFAPPPVRHEEPRGELGERRADLGQRPEGGERLGELASLAVMLCERLARHAVGKGVLFAGHGHRARVEERLILLLLARELRRLQRGRRDGVGGANAPSPPQPHAFLKQLEPLLARLQVAHHLERLASEHGVVR